MTSIGESVHIRSTQTLSMYGPGRFAERMAGGRVLVHGLDSRTSTVQDEWAGHARKTTVLFAKRSYVSQNEERG